MKAYGEVDVYIHMFFTSVFRFLPLPLYPRRKSRGTNWTEGHVGPTAGLDDVEKRKFLTLPGLNSGTSFV
jgi:hypothetical protein